MNPSLKIDAFFYSCKEADVFFESTIEDAADKALVAFFKKGKKLPEFITMQRHDAIEMPMWFFDSVISDVEKRINKVFFDRDEPTEHIKKFFNAKSVLAAWEDLLKALRNNVPLPNELIEEIKVSTKDYSVVQRSSMAG